MVYANVVNASSPLYDYDWNYSVPGFSTLTTTPYVLGVVYNDVMLCMNGSYPVGTAASVVGSFSWAPYTYFAINLNATVGAIGSVLWWNTITPSGNNTISWGGIDPTASDGLGNTGVFVEACRETDAFIGYSLTTGQKIWGDASVRVQADLDYYGSPAVGTITDQLAYGNLYSGAYAGIIYCYNLTTGNIEWTYGNGGEGNSTNSGLNTPYGDYPTFVNAVGDGVIYLVTTEHTITDPIWKGAMARAINATTGAQIWELSSFTSEFGAMSYAIADGYATWFNGYDDSVYSVGQGPSATTVQAPLTAITAGTNVVIQGTVMDISAGTQQTEQKADFPAGVPVASDASMSQWMSYVYQQQPEPTNFTGVPVTLTAIDPNGNFITLGTATTDSNGLYGYQWTPPAVPGLYTVTATFAGTNGYWGSKAQTAMTVQNAPATPAPTASPLSLASTQTYIVGIGIAIIVVIIVIGAVLAMLMLRKRP